MRALRLVAILASVLCLIECTSPTPQPSPETDSGAFSWPVFKSIEVPWTFPTPRDWDVTTSRSDPNPRYMVGVLRSWAGTVRFQRQFESGPNSGSGALEELGQSAVLVKIQLLWSPADEPIEWTPGPTSALTRKPPSEWHDDAQNPGWMFRERKVCLGDGCVSVLEWRGPEASANDILLAETVAESVELQEAWTDP